MSLFKRKKEKITAEPASDKPLEDTMSVVAPKPKSADSKFFLGVIKRARITEKSSLAAEHDKYVFVVSSDANKNQIKNDVTAKFGVSVRSVNIVRLPAKERRRGTIVGHKPGVKKAIVTVKEGEKIEIQ